VPDTTTDKPVNAQSAQAGASHSQPIQQQPSAATAIPRLILPREHAEVELKSALKIGNAIYGQRIRNRWELDQARGEKQEWVSRTTELLRHLFGGDSAVADSCNDWAATILPEYAELGLFIELFENEMKHRLGRLKNVIKSLESYGAPSSVIDASGSQQQQQALQRQVLPQQAGVFVSFAAAAAAAAQGGSPGAPAAHRPHAEVKMTQPNHLSNGPSSSAHPGDAVDHLADVSVVYRAPVSAHGLLVAHSADAAARAALEKFLQQLGLTLTIIDRTEGGVGDGKLLDALQRHGSAAFAMVLVDVTDAKGAPGLRSAEFHYDLGCCAGRFGSERVCVLGRGANPAAEHAVHGLTHASIDTADGWQLPLARELKKLGLPVDLNKLL